MELSSFIKPYRKKLSVASLTKFVEALLELYLPILMAKILDIGIPMNDKTFIVKTGLNILILSLLGFLCATFCQYTASAASQSIGASLRDGMIEKISSFSYSELDSFGTATLVNRFSSDVNNYQNMVSLVVRLGSRSPAIGLGAIIMSLLIDARLAVIFIVLVPILAVIISFFMRYTSPLFKIAQGKLDQFALIIRENLSGIRVIRAFATTKGETEKADKIINETSQAYTKVGSIFASMQPLNSIFLNFAIILLLFFGSKFVYKGELRQGEILSLTIYANKILYALVTIANLVVTVTKGSVSGKRIAEIFSVEPSINFDTKTTPIKDDTVPYLQVKDVSFSYNQSAPLLDNISFDMEKCSTLGVVGVTGSGKSTLLNMLQRFYEPNLGSILIQGIDINDYSKKDLRELIGVVPQNNVLFSGTIADNMKMSAPNTTNESIIAALKTAQCWDFVEALSQGINSEIFEGGKNFSGGQRQRLAIARALVKNPEILLLDDSLSALDYQTDYHLRTSLKSDYPELSTIIVSQRISSVISANKIVVLNQSKLVGMGTHEELLRDCLPYLEIYKSQTENISLEEVSDEK